jgi:hypothetical protein
MPDILFKNKCEIRTIGETPEKGTLAIDFGGSKRLQLHAARFSRPCTGRGGRRLDTVGFQQDLAFVFLPDAVPPRRHPSLIIIIAGNKLRIAAGLPLSFS